MKKLILLNYDNFYKPYQGILGNIKNTKCIDPLSLSPNWLDGLNIHLKSLSKFNPYFIRRCLIILLWKEITENRILHIKCKDFLRQMSAYKFQGFITIEINSLSLPKVLYDIIEINYMLNLINILNFVWNNFHWVSYACLASEEYTSLVVCNDHVPLINISAPRIKYMIIISVLF